MKKQRILSLCLALLLLLSLAACDKQAEEQSAPPTKSAEPTHTPEPTPEPTPPIPYTDVPEDSYYYDAVVWAYENGIASDGETFEPLSTCTRGQVITFLWRAMGSPEPQLTESPVTDIAPSDWFYKPVLWAYETGISTSSAFKPKNSCTNGEALTFLWRTEGRPMAVVSGSTVALAASGAYYERPAAWADSNGLFAQMGAAFDPSAPCSRAYLMSYLHWAEEQWTRTREDEMLQAEYEYILNSADTFGAYGGGLCSAEYIDVEGDGEIELLTLEVSAYDYSSRYSYRTVTATVYGSVDGHAGKTCEQTFSTYRGDDFSTYQAGGQLYLCQNVYSGNAGETYDFYRIEKNAIPFCEQATFWWRGGNSDQDDAIRQKYTNQKSWFTISSDDVPSIVNRGLAPGWGWEERDKYWTEHAEHWRRYWTNRWASDPMYAAVLNGDFSAFAGTYESEYSGGNRLTLNKDGTLTDGLDYFHATSQKPVSINVTANGVIRCVITPVGTEVVVDREYGEEWAIWHGDVYDICPVGIEYGEYDFESGYTDRELGSDKVRIMYTHWGGSAGADTSQYYKAP